jgi:predicted nucleic acid-binding protein
MVFLDASVILEITLYDRPHFKQAQKFLETVEDDTAISMLSAHLIMHFGRKQQIADPLLQGVIGENELLAITPEDYVWALANERGKDFGDALQIATAIRSGCTTFVTFDASLAKAYTSLPMAIVIPR